jgi:hypothetical protein
MVIDLTVKNNNDIPGSVLHGLMTRIYINNRKATMTQIRTLGWVIPVSLVVRPAMHEGCGHGVENGLVTRTNKSCDATHQSKLIFS